MNNWELVDTVRYRINGDDLLVDVDRGWQRFAVENGAPQLLSNHVLGRSLWDFISDVETRAIYQAMLQKVRSNKETVSVELRCDAPDRRRFIRLDITSLSRQRVQFVGTILKVERRDEVPLLEPDGDRSSDILTICSWCKSVLMPDGRYVEIEAAVNQLGLFNAEVLPQLSHGICPSCWTRVTKDLD
jgi:hypothetical protein